MKNAILLSLILITYSGFSQVICPDDITIDCAQDYTDLTVTGQIIVPDSINNGNYIVDYDPQLNACNEGIVNVLFYVEDSLYCTQIITIDDPYPAFDPNTIIIPEDITVADCSWVEFNPPSWLGGPCDFIGYIEDVDTLDFTVVGEYKIERVFTVIDWCLYDATNGADGLYYGSQVITIIDEVSPITNCPTTMEYSIDNLPLTITAKSIGLDATDDCTDQENLRFTFTEVRPGLDPDFDTMIKSSTMVLTAEDFAIGTFFIDVYHWDLAGNSSSCTTILGNLTGIEDIKEETILLSNNYPNPFHEYTTLQFNIKSTADISLTIFDINGKEYFSESKKCNAGEHKKTIDLSDAPSGIYFYKVSTKDSGTIQKMIRL